MILYLYVLLISWLWGALQEPVPLQGWKEKLWAFFKGVVAVLAARLVNNTGLTMAISALGVLIGHSWSPFRRLQERSARWVGLGVLLVFSPVSAVLAALAASAIYFISDSGAMAQAGVSLLLPFILWRVERFDIYIILGIILAIILVYQAIPLFSFRNVDRKRQRLRQILAISLIGALSVLVFFNRYVYRGFGQQVGIIRRGTQEFKVVALTFDDGPDPLYTPGILDILAEYDVPATFFMVGSHAERYPDLVKRIFQEGHGVGNHTWSHRSLIPLSVDRTRSEIMKAHRIIEEITGSPPRFFRPPRGVYSNFAREFLQEEDYTIVLWDVTSQDWAEIPARSIANNVLANACPGSIILFHDSGNLVSAEGGNRLNTLKALPIVIEGLLEQGYTFMTIDELVILTGLTGEEGIE